MGKINYGNPFEKVPVDIWDITTKEKIFTGSQAEAARFISTSASNISVALCRKQKIKRRYAVRMAKVE